jgi:hypothetical protein
MSTPTPTAAATSATRPSKRPATAKPRTDTTDAAAKAATKPTAKGAAPGAAATKQAATKQAATKQAATARPLHEREPRAVVTATGFALASLVADAVATLGRLPRDAERLRDEVRPIAEAAPELLRSELERAERALAEAIDARAPRGRDVVAGLAARPAVQELRERAEAVRARLQRALGIREDDAR